MVLVGPDIVIGCEADGGVTHLRFTGELGLRQRRHANDARAPRPVELRLRLRREERPLHADIGAAVVMGDALCGTGLQQHRPEVGVEGMAEANMHREVVVEGVDPVARPVDRLVGNHEVAGLDLAPQRPNRRHRREPEDAERLQRPDVGPHRNLRRVVAVTAAVTRKKGHFPIAQQADHDLVGRHPEGRLDRHLVEDLQTVDLIQPRTADNANFHIAVHHLSLQFPCIPACGGGILPPRRAVKSRAQMAAGRPPKICFTRLHT